MLSKSFYLSCFFSWLLGVGSLWVTLWVVRVKPDGYMPGMDDLQDVEVSPEGRRLIAEIRNSINNIAE